jgi:hypothetical protein
VRCFWYLKCRQDIHIHLKKKGAITAQNAISEHHRMVLSLPEKQKHVGNNTVSEEREVEF